MNASSISRVRTRECLKLVPPLLLPLLQPLLLLPLMLLCC